MPYKSILVNMKQKRMLRTQSLLNIVGFRIAVFRKNSNMQFEVLWHPVNADIT